MKKIKEVVPMKKSLLVSIAVAIGLPLYFLTCHFAESQPLWYLGTAVSLVLFFFGIVNVAKESKQKYC